MAAAVQPVILGLGAVFTALNSEVFEDLKTSFEWSNVLHNEQDEKDDLSKLHDDEAIDIQAPTPEVKKKRKYVKRGDKALKLTDYPDLAEDEKPILSKS